MPLKAFPWIFGIAAVACIVLAGLPGIPGWVSAFSILFAMLTGQTIRAIGIRRARVEAQESLPLE